MFFPSSPGWAKKRPWKRKQCEFIKEAWIDLDDCDVDEGQVEVDELKAEHLEGVALLEVGLGPWLFKFDQPQGNILIQLKYRKQFIFWQNESVHLVETNNDQKIQT